MFMGLQSDLGNMRGGEAEPAEIVRELEDKFAH
jgi:hypothetical protein